MKRHPKISFQSIYFMTAAVLLSCNGQEAAPSKELISEINLKRGAVISCSPSGEQFGSVDFEMSCDEKVKNDFNLAIELLHSFEYDESEKAFLFQASLWYRTRRTTETLNKIRRVHPNHISKL